MASPTEPPKRSDPACRALCIRGFLNRAHEKLSTTELHSVSMMTCVMHPKEAGVCRRSSMVWSFIEKPSRASKNLYSTRTETPPPPSPPNDANFSGISGSCHRLVRRATVMADADRWQTEKSGHFDTVIHTSADAVARRSRISDQHGKYNSWLWVQAVIWSAEGDP